MMWLPCTLSLSTLIALLSMTPSVLATCYFPNGLHVPPEDAIPCPDSKACCPKDAFCLSNGLCWTAWNHLVRYACSDQSWTSRDCPVYCLDISPSSGEIMTPCNGKDLFACHYNTCATRNFTVSIGYVVLRDYQKLSLGALLVTVAAAAATTTDAFTSVPTLAPSVTVTVLSATTHACISSIPLTSSSSSTSTTSTTSTSSSPASIQSSKLAGVGAGVGAPMAIALVAALALLMRERRKARDLELENARLIGGGGGGSGSGSGSGGGGGGGVGEGGGPSMVGSGKPPPYHQLHPALRGHPIEEDGGGA